MILRPVASRNVRRGRCSGCSRQREVFELDGTDRALCATCIGSQLEMAGELLATRDLYEGASVLDWLAAHNGHTGAGIVGCPFCGARSVS